MIRHSDMMSYELLRHMYFIFEGYVHMTFVRLDVLHTYAYDYYDGRGLILEAPMGCPFIYVEL